MAPAYMAPEQLRGAEVTAKSDIDAVGLVLYELSRVSGPATPIPFRPCYASRNCAIDGHDFDRRRYRSGRLYGAGRHEGLTPDTRSLASSPSSSAYSCRSAMTGLIRIARRAGIQQASDAMANINSSTMAKVSGSPG